MKLQYATHIDFDYFGIGIGRAVALKLAQCGAKVVAISRTQADLDSLKEEVDSLSNIIIEPRHVKICLQGVRLGPTQSGLYDHRRWPEA